MSDHSGTLCVKRLKRYLHWRCFTWRCTKPGGYLFWKTQSWKSEIINIDIGIEIKLASKSFLMEDGKNTITIMMIMIKKNMEMKRKEPWHYRKRVTRNFFLTLLHSDRAIMLPRTSNLRISTLNYSDKALMSSGTAEKVRLTQRSLYQIIFWLDDFSPAKLVNK